MKQVIITMLLLASLFRLNAQQSITLKQCYDQALAVSALAGEAGNYHTIWQINDKNLSKNLLPTLDAGGSFIYNSSVIDLSEVMGALPIPGLADAIKPMPHEQYKITLDIYQVIYDGGATRSARELGRATLGVNSKQSEADLYKLRAQVNGYYFNLLLLGRQKALLINYLDLIEQRLKAVNSAVTSGMALKTDLDVLMAEKLKMEQQLAENNIRLSAFKKILADLTRLPLDAGTLLQLPDLPEPLSDHITRPELQLFDLRGEQLTASLKLLETKRMPKAVGFATLGYGNPPGSNFFRNEFAPFAIVGAGLKWNIFDYNRVRDEKQVLVLQKGMLNDRKSDLSAGLQRILDAKRAEIASFESLLETDNDLIELRKRITAAAASKYENGSITASEFLSELNAEKQAMINREMHAINLILARVEYLNISGQEIE